MFRGNIRLKLGPVIINLVECICYIDDSTKLPIVTLLVLSVINLINFVCRKILYFHRHQSAYSPENTLIYLGFSMVYMGRFAVSTRETQRVAVNPPLKR